MRGVRNAMVLAIVAMLRPGAEAVRYGNTDPAAQLKAATQAANGASDVAEPHKPRFFSFPTVISVLEMLGRSWQISEKARSKGIVAPVVAALHGKSATEGEAKEEEEVPQVSEGVKKAAAAHHSAGPPM